MTVPSCAARERAPTGEELPGLSMVLGSPARLLHREKGSSCKLIKQETEWVTGRGICQHNLIFSTPMDSQESHLFISQWGKEPVVCSVGFVFHPNVLLKKIQFYWNWSYLSVAIKNLWNYMTSSCLKFCVKNFISELWNFSCDSVICFGGLFFFSFYDKSTITYNTCYYDWQVLPWQNVWHTKLLIYF